MNEARVSVLILGFGWSGPFLKEVLTQQAIPYSATTRDGRDDTIAWELPSQDDQEVDVSALPAATTVLVTFPVRSAKSMEKLMDAYEARQGGLQQQVQWILLSSTRVYDGDKCDRHGPINLDKDSSGRSEGEQVTLARGGTVVHLAGLWGAQRQPRNWVSRFSTPEALRGKLLQRQLHLIHGQDVARALVLGVHGQFAKAQGQRWIVTDGGCYDWVKLILAWGSQEQVETTQKLIPSVLGNTTTIYNLVDPNNGVIIHPRLDSTEFWDTFGLKPTQFLQVP
ncbi:hypothetical protein RO3G_02053 [Lichtheimia corymbifera JMRC:FSU:9682]|uniref:Uncharacterized protein n=1 Tax=Lichtheimia corymbifera JMRC:FSU:9682 TaxID=1263082 RepID=A0A068RZS5_9FUNG|nr:hypothetical protein RO3G_02053 [Lichtheimia corymbifera JMRC:FSU:9682]